MLYGLDDLFSKKIASLELAKLSQNFGQAKTSGQSSALDAGSVLAPAPATKAQVDELLKHAAMIVQF
jgi:hypothetical protein